MEADVIRDKCSDILNSLSLNARKAYLLAYDYSKSLETKSIINLEFEKLDKFCKEHKEIRSEIRAARDKVRSIIKEDERSDDCLALPTRQKIKEIERDIKRAKNKQSYMSPKQKFFDIISTVFFIIGIVLVGLAAINLVVGAVYIMCDLEPESYHDVLVSRFWKYIFLICIDAGIWYCLPRSAKKTALLELELSKLYSQLE